MAVSIVLLSLLFPLVSLRFFLISTENGGGHGGSDYSIDGGVEARVPSQDEVDFSCSFTPEKFEAVKKTCNICGIETALLFTIEGKGSQITTSCGDFFAQTVEDVLNGCDQPSDIKFSSVTSFQGNATAGDTKDLPACLSSVKEIPAIWAGAPSEAAGDDYSGADDSGADDSGADDSGADDSGADDSHGPAIDEPKASMELRCSFTPEKFEVVNKACSVCGFKSALLFVTEEDSVGLPCLNFEKAVEDFSENCDQQYSVGLKDVQGFEGDGFGFDKSKHPEKVKECLSAVKGIAEAW